MAVDKESDAEKALREIKTALGTFNEGVGNAIMSLRERASQIQEAIEQSRRKDWELNAELQNQVKKPNQLNLNQAKLNTKEVMRGGIKNSLFNTDAAKQLDKTLDNANEENAEKKSTLQQTPTLRPPGSRGNKI